MRIVNVLQFKIIPLICILEYKKLLNWWHRDGAGERICELLYLQPGPHVTLPLTPSCLAIGTNVGFKIFNLSPLSLLSRVESGAIHIVEMLYATNIVAVVGRNERGTFTRKRLSLWDINAACSRLDIAFNSDILYVKMNRRK